MKKTLKKAIIFTIIGLVLGVYFREFTKWNGFVEDGALIGPTSLSFMHTHMLTLGTVMTLLFGTILNQQGLGLQPLGKRWVFYEIGVYLTVLMMFIRGNIQVLNINLSNALDASISGLAGLSHIILGVSFILILLKLYKTAEH